MYREEAGFSATAAAEAAGVHRNTIYDLEKDEDGVTLRLMKRVADAYGKTLGEIFQDERTPERVPVEFRPLLEPLRALDFPARVSLIRNVAANLNFMASQFASAAPTTLRSEEVASSGNLPVHTSVSQTLLTGGITPEGQENAQSAPLGNRPGRKGDRK
jgi:DNA-binding XRE family transcriptional regulator